MHACINLNLGKGRGALRSINREKKDTVQLLLESNGWPWNVEETDVCETEHSTVHVTR